MRRVILLLCALLLLGASAALAQGAFPKKIALPNAFAPEGIEVGNGNTVYVGSVGTGAVWVGNLRTGSGRILVAGAPNVRSATGIEFDHGRLWVSGARFGNASGLQREDGRADPGAAARDRHGRDVHQRRRRDEQGRLLHRLAAARDLQGRGCPATAVRVR